MQAGERTFVPQAPIDPALADEQHLRYCQLLARCGAEVVTLPALADLPDSTFVEDTAIVLDEVAVLCSMGAPSRRGEPPFVEKELARFRQIARIELPATIDGGDVLQLGRRIFVGRSSRTNDAALGCLAQLGRRFGYEVTPIRVRGCLHLKTACTALPDGRLLVNKAWIDPAPLAAQGIVEVPPTEPWGANVLAVGDAVIIEASHAATAELLDHVGYRVQRTNLSEFSKAEGGVTCLSLLVA
jgi:dimethylargininase